MRIIDASTQLKALSKAQALNQMPFASYISERKLILDALDQRMNGVTFQAEVNSLVDPNEMTQQIPASPIEEQQDKTQPYFAGKVDKYINLFKGTTNK